MSKMSFESKTQPVKSEYDLNTIKTEFKYPLNVSYNVILGCPRSGTTFLINSLRALPNYECVSGHLIPLSIPHVVNHSLSPEIYQCLLNSFEFSLQDYLSSVAKARFQYLQKWLDNCISTKELIQAFQRKRKIESIIYKEPFLSFAPEYTYNALPNCRIIHIYRDGRDCADSLSRKYKSLTDEKLAQLNTGAMLIGRKYDYRYIPWWVEEGQEEEFLACTPYVRAIWMWKEMVKRCHDFFTRPDVVASGRVMLLKYEDLVNEPDKYGKLVVEHFGSSMNNRIRRKFELAKISSIGIHQKNRDVSEIKSAEKVAGAELELYGYL